MLDPGRAVQTVAVDADGKLWFGSGYLLSADLVLTAAHALHGVDKARVRLVDAPGRVREVWAETVFADPRADVAVLRLSVPETVVVAPVVFGKPVGPADCDTAGFPLLQLNDDHRAASPFSPLNAPEGERRYRDSHHVSGICMPGSNRYAGTLKVLVPAPAPDPDGGSPWAGMSGAAVFAGGALIAVVTEHHPRQGLGALTASPVDNWFRLLDTAALDRLRTVAGLPDAEHLVEVGNGAAAPGAVEVPLSLPRDVVSYADRGGELAALVAVLDEAERSGPGAVLPIHVVEGMAGIGKTTFAVHAAHALADRFPDGQWFVRLHAHTPKTEPADPDRVLGDLLTADGVTGGLADVPDRAGLWRARTAGRRMILVLDDALNSAQVRPLLPKAPGTLVLVTSRRPLTGLADVTPVGLGVPEEPRACELFTGFVGRPDLRPDDPRVVELVRRCGRLPMAIGIVAARLRHHRSWTVQDLIDEMADYGPLPTLIGEDESVAAAFQLSYQDLNLAQQAMFQILGTSPAVDADVGAAAAMADLDARAARRLLQDLEEHHLLIEPTRGRYLMHDLLREYAGTLSGADADPGHGHAAAERLLTHYRRSAAAQRARGAEAELSWLRGERLNLLACLDYAAHQGRDEALIGLTADLAPLLLTEGPWATAKTVHARAVAVAERRGDDRTALATALDNLGRVQSMTGDYADAIASLVPALALFEEVGDRTGQAAARNDLGRMRYKVGDYAGAARDLEQALEEARRNGDPSRQATVLHDLGRLRSKTDRRDEALRDQQQALELFRQVGDRTGETGALNELGLVWQDDDDAVAVGFLESALTMAVAGGDQIGHIDALHGLGVRTAAGDRDGALRFLERSLELARQTGDRFGQAQALGSLGRVSRRAGDFEAAIGFLEQSVGLARQIGYKFGEAVALEEMGLSWASAGRADEAGDCLRQAVEVYGELGLEDRVRRVAAQLADIDGGES